MYLSDRNDGRIGTTVNVRITPEVLLRLRALADSYEMSRRLLLGKLIEEGVERLEKEGSST